MSQSSVYLCPSCQEVIRSEGRKREDLVCGACGFELGAKKSVNLPGNARLPDLPNAGKTLVSRDIGKTAILSKTELPGKPLPAPIKAKLPEPKEAEESQPEIKRDSEFHEKEVILPDGTRQVRRRKKRRKEKNKTLYLFLGSWLLVVITIVAFFMMPKFKDDQADEPIVDDSEEAARRARHIQFLKEHRVAAVDSFSRYLNTPKDDGRIQRIDYSSQLATKFGRFYNYEAPLFPTAGLHPVDIQVVEFAEGKATPGIEMIWRTREGHDIEVLSVWNGSAWMIDWEHLVRYGSEPWALFRLGVGSSKKGTFRLLARKTTISNETETEVVFYMPSRPGRPEAENLLDRSTPEVVFSTTDDLGVQFNRLWADYEAGLTQYDSKFPERDPKGYMRITATLGWSIDERGDNILSLLEIIEPSWYGKRVQEIHQKFPPEISIKSSVGPLPEALQ